MAKKYAWRTATDIISGGYPGEETGVLGGQSDWVETDLLNGTTTAQYYYRDSNSLQNSQSSRVVVTIQESWTASINNKNLLTVTLQTTIQSIARDDIRGNPGTVGRNIFVRREEGGPVLWTISNDSVSTAHTIMGTPLVLDTYTFTLAPGENLSRGSIYYRNNAVGHDGDAPPSVYVDLMWLGTEFKNILPKDYRPGATLDSSQEYGNVTDGVWVTHNDKNGGCHVLSNVNSMTWKEMRTLGNGTIQTQAPSILTTDDAPNSWYNQKELGKYLRT